MAYDQTSAFDTPIRPWFGKRAIQRQKRKGFLSVSLTKVQKQTLEEMADRSELSLARVVQEAVKEFLENHRDRLLPLFERTPPHPTLSPRERVG